VNRHAQIVMDDGRGREPAPWRIHGQDGARRGMVLLLVVIVVVMISLAGLSFVAWMFAENKAVRLRGDELQVAQVVASGSVLIESFLEQTPEARRAAGGTIDNPELFCGQGVFMDTESGAIGGRFSIVAPRIEDGRIVGARFGLENESARLNLGVLLDWDKREEGAARRALMRLPGMTESTADAILDWIDPDTTPRQFGAETDHYSSLNLCYGPRGATPVSLEELLLVRDVSRELLFGGDLNLNYLVDEEEQRRLGGQTSTTNGEDLPWASLLTIHSAERNVNAQGQPRVFLNDPNLRQLHRRLGRLWDKQRADFVIFYRQYGPYQGDRPAGSARAFRVDYAKSGRFRFKSVLDLVGAKVRLPRAVHRSRPILESPFSDDRDTMREELPKLLDAVTTTRARILRGRVNVNEAPRSVLLAVPGLSEATVERILVERVTHGQTPDASRQEPTWLLTDGLVDLEAMRSLLPYLTTGGDVYRAQVVGTLDGSHTTGRVEVAFDATRDPPRRIYWKDLSLLGRGYSLEVFGEEGEAE